MINSNQNTPKLCTDFATLYELDNVPKENLSEKITRQYITGTKSMFVKWTLKKGAVVSMHDHPNEQIIWIMSGAAKVISQHKEFILQPGSIMVLPPGVPHELHALEDTINIDFFTPIREDWGNNTPEYLL